MLDEVARHADRFCVRDAEGVVDDGERELKILGEAVDAAERRIREEACLEVRAQTYMPSTTVST